MRIAFVLRNMEERGSRNRWREVVWEGKGNKKKSRCAMYVSLLPKMNANFVYCKHMLIR